MKPICLLSLLFGLAGFGNEPASKVIETFVLEAKTMYRIPVSRQRVTTFVFPGPITALDGAFISEESQGGMFEIAFSPGSFFFSIRALEEGASSNLNVMWRRTPYVIELFESKEPLLSVRFEEPLEAHGKPQSRPVSPTILLGLLDKAKAYAVLRQHHPKTVSGIQYRKADQVTDYGEFQLRIQEVFRFDLEDTMVFSLQLQNMSNQPIYYDPRSLGVRVGKRFYPQSISDAAGIIPPRQTMPAFIAITSTPAGGRNDLSIKNDFLVVVERTAPPLKKERN